MYQQSAEILDLPFNDIQTLQDLIDVFGAEMTQSKNLIALDDQM